MYTHTYTPTLSGERSRPSLRLLSAIPGDARDSLHVDLIRPACTTCPGGADDGALCGIPRPPPQVPVATITTPDRGVSEGYAYVRMRNKYPWTNCLRTRQRQAGPIRFNSAACLLLLHRLRCSRSRFFFLSFFSVSLSPDLHDPVSPRRTIDPRLTSFRAVSLNSIYDFPFFSSSLCFLPPFFSSPEKELIIVDLSMIIRDILVRRG